VREIVQDARAKDPWKLEIRCAPSLPENVALSYFNFREICAAKTRQKWRDDLERLKALLDASFRGIQAA
jgi:predicted secreted protein